MADKAIEKAQQTARETADTASEAVGKATDTARRTTEAATNGYEELLTLSRHNMEGVAKASQAMLKGASELGSLWASFWNEQLTTGWRRCARWPRVTAGIKRSKCRMSSPGRASPGSAHGPSRAPR